MGAEVRGVDLARLTDEQFAEIRAALFRHKMIYSPAACAGSRRRMSAGTTASAYTRRSTTTTTFAASSTARPLPAKRRREAVSRAWSRLGGGDQGAHGSAGESARMTPGIESVLLSRAARAANVGGEARSSRQDRREALPPVARPSPAKEGSRGK
jgi:hypothetical protein